jgi:tRNA(Ile2) C34 agmatinyltransferase TiaS
MECIKCKMTMASGSSIGGVHYYKCYRCGTRCSKDTNNDDKIDWDFDRTF